MVKVARMKKEYVFCGNKDVSCFEGKDNKLSTNSNACSGDSDTDTSCLENDSDKHVEKQKYIRKKKVKFNAEKVLEESVVLEINHKNSSECNASHKSDDTVNTSKDHPAVSTRINKKKLFDASDYSGKDKDSVKEVLMYKEVLDRHKQEVESVKNIEKQLKTAWVNNTVMPHQNSDKEKDQIKEKSTMKIKPSTAGFQQVISQSVEMNIKLAETPWTSFNAFQKYNEKEVKLKSAKDTDMKVQDSNEHTRISRQTGPRTICSEDDVSGKIINRYTILNNSEKGSGGELVQTPTDDIDYAEIQQKDNYNISNFSNLAFDQVQNVDCGNKMTKKPMKFESNLTKITEEKEPSQEKNTKILKKIYEEVYVDHKTFNPSKKHSSICNESKNINVYDYETTDDEIDVCDGSESTKHNTVVIPKPRAKPNMITDVKGVNKLNEKEKQHSQVASMNSKYVGRTSESQEDYTTDDIISDITSCQAALHPNLAPPKPRETTLAPNPFPVNKYDLTEVFPPKTEKPKYRRKKIAHNPLLAGVDENPAIQRISAPTQLGKLKEVSNRLEPTPEIFLRTGKKENYDSEDKSIQFGAYVTSPMGKLQTKGKDSKMVDVKFFTQYQDLLKQQKNDGNDDSIQLSQSSIPDNLPNNPTEMLQNEQLDGGSQPSLYLMPDNLTNNPTLTQKKYSKVQCTFRARDEHLPDAKFWIDLAKGNIPLEYKSIEDVKSYIVIDNMQNLPLAPIGFTGVGVGISKSEAELNKIFFSKVVSKPEFSKKNNSGHHWSDMHPLDSISTCKKSTAEENLSFFRTVATNPEFWAPVPKAEKLDQYIAEVPTNTANILVDESHAINAKENLEFFRNVSKHPEFFHTGTSAKVKYLPRSYFNEPPLGVDDELPGRRHSREDENLQFFLTVSRNPSTFYTKPNAPFKEKPAPPSLPQGYCENKGYIPDDPNNYINEDTAQDNLEFFRNLAKDPGYIEKITSKDKNNMQGALQETNKERADANLEFFRNIYKSSMQNQRHD